MPAFTERKNTNERRKENHFMKGRRKARAVTSTMFHCGLIEFCGKDPTDFNESTIWQEKNKQN